jgi:hypothetical protein
MAYGVQITVALEPSRTYQGPDAFSEQTVLKVGAAAINLAPCNNQSDLSPRGVDVRDDKFFDLTALSHAETPN